MPAPTILYRAAAGRLLSIAENDANLLEIATSLGQGVPETTKGDIGVNNGTTNVRLPVGATNGHVLKVNSAAETGLEYGADSGVALRTELVTDSLTTGAAIIPNAAQHVNGIAVMRTLAVVSGRSIWRKYHTTAGDGGHVQFRGITGAAPGTYVDNNGTIVVPTGGDGSAAWVAVYSGAVNVKWFHATGDGSTDDTTALQAALTASTDVYIPMGRYIVSSTLTAQKGSQIRGAGAESTLLQRTANYGDTLKIGTTTPGEGALNCHVSGIWFYKPQTYVAGTTTTITNPVTAGSAHLNITVASRATVEDCWFTNMPYGVTWYGSSLGKVKGCNFTGIWDPNIAGLQEGIAAIWFKAAGSYNVLMAVDDCHVAGGYGSAARNVVIGTATLNFSESIGQRYGILVDSTEGLTVHDSYIGGQSSYGIYLNKPAGAIMGNIKITENFFDPAIHSSIYVSTETDAIDGIIINDNGFNGQNAGLHAVYVNNPGALISCISLEMTGNFVENYCKTEVVLLGVTGAIVNANRFASYNYALGGAADGLYASGVYVGGDSTMVDTGNNVYGGGVNNLSPVNNCQYGIYWSTYTKGSSYNERTVGLGVGGGAVVYNNIQALPPGRAQFQADSEIYAIGLSYNAARAQAAQSAFLGATDSATPDAVISNSAGSRILTCKNSRAIGLDSYVAGTLVTNAIGDVSAASPLAIAAAATTSAGQISYGATTATTVGAAGGASALPATPTGYIIVNIAGTNFKLPYYAN